LKNEIRWEFVPEEVDVESVAVKIYVEGFEGDLVHGQERKSFDFSEETLKKKEEKKTGCRFTECWKDEEEKKGV
jgi:hypothetical protein